MKLDGAVDAEARVCSCYGQIYENLAMRFLALCKRCLSIESLTDTNVILGPCL